MAKGLWIGLGITAAVLITAIYFIMNGINKQGSQPEPQTSNNPPAESSGANNIEIKNFAFSPSALTIKKGGTVVWTNRDLAPHTIISDSGGEIDSGTISKGQTYSHTFSSQGTFDYHCGIHPSMKAKIIVE